MTKSGKSLKRPSPTTIDDLLAIANQESMVVDDEQPQSPDKAKQEDEKMVNLENLENLQESENAQEQNPFGNSKVIGNKRVHFNHQVDQYLYEAPTPEESS